MIKTNPTFMLILGLIVISLTVPKITAVSNQPDLSITDITLNPDGKPVLELVNFGPGFLNDCQRAVPILYIYRNDRVWGSLSLNNIDPQNKLSRVGGKISYVLNKFEIPNSETIQAVIDPHNFINEITKKNNTLRKQLTILLPDLKMSDIYLNDQNMLAIEISNIGSGTINKTYWENSQVSFYIYRRGKLWGGISLKRCDPLKKLHLPKTKVLYLASPIKVDRPEQIQVVIDPQNRVREFDESNNSLQKILTPTKPDLAVANLWVVNGNWLALQVTNCGSKSISAQYWEDNPVYFNIYRNGKSWARISLKTIDPRRNLTKPGGKVVYISPSIRIFGSEEIRGVIDSQNSIIEADETNNTFHKTLSAQN